MICRHCNSNLIDVFVDLEYSPIANEMLSVDKLSVSEEYFPLKIYVCQNCWLVQVDEMKHVNLIFNENYTYFSSFSKSWLKHAEEFVDMVINRFNLGKNTQVIEIASNDGYLLQYFKPYGIPVLGIEPSANTAQQAKDKGIEVIVDFFSDKLAQEQLVDRNRKADLLIGNNVLAHVPEINDFVKGLKTALAQNGIISMEFAYLVKLVHNNAYDTIYHEHFSYLSLIAVKGIFESHGLEVFDAVEIPEMGGGLRIFAKHSTDKSRRIEPSVQNIIDNEISLGVNTIGFYSDFQDKVNQIKYESLSFIIDKIREGKKIIGYGAAAKGNTFLNHMGIKGTDMIRLVVDASPHKQEKYLPGSHIPVTGEEKIREIQPDYVLLLPWNLKKELSQELSYIKEWGGRFVVFFPELEVF